MIRPTSRAMADSYLKRKVTDAEWADLQRPNGDKNALRIIRHGTRHYITAPWLLSDVFGV